MVRATIDRIENGTAVLILNSGSHQPVVFPSVLLPDGCREGDIVTLTFERDPQETQKGRYEIEKQIGRINKKYMV